MYAKLLIRVGRQLNGDRLRLQIQIQSLLAQFASMSRLLVATERSLRRYGIVTVHPHLAGFDALGKHEGGVQILCDHTGRQTKVRLVGALQHLLKGFELEDRLNRAKDLRRNKREIIRT